MNALKILVVMTLTYSINVQAREVGNIKCSPSLSTGEMVVCDYAIIGNKYEKLYEAYLSNGRNPILETSIQKEISECDGLSCVEQVIDKTMAQPVVEKESAVSTQGLLNHVAEANGAKLIKESSTTLEQPRANLEKKESVTKAENQTQNDEDKGAFAGWLMLAFIIVFVLIGYKIVSLLRPKPNPNKPPGTGAKLLTLIWAGLTTPPSNSQGHDGTASGSGNTGVSSGSEEKMHYAARASASQTGGVTYIKPYNGSQHDGYVWDGTCLKPYSGSQHDGYVWDGTYLKPYNGSQHDGYVWDGTYLKPYNGSQHDGYVWDGTYLKPYSGSQHDGYELSGQSMKPYGGSIFDSYESSAELPIPVWAVVLGLILKK